MLPNTSGYFAPKYAAHSPPFEYPATVVNWRPCSTSRYCFAHGTTSCMM